LFLLFVAIVVVVVVVVVARTRRSAQGLTLISPLIGNRLLLLFRSFFYSGTSIYQFAAVALLMLLSPTIEGGAVLSVGSPWSSQAAWQGGRTGDGRSPRRRESPSTTEFRLRAKSKSN
jgi:hypothetical protein